MSRERDVRKTGSLLLRLVTLLVVLLLAAPEARAVEPADVSFNGPFIDLMPNFGWLTIESKSVTIERPDRPDGPKQFMMLQAAGEAASYNWGAVGFKNTASDPRSMVIFIPDRGFLGSGLVWPKLPGGGVIRTVAGGPLELRLVDTTGGRAFAFTLPPGASGAIAFQTTSDGLETVQLWREPAFTAQKDYYAFFRGALLGISVLLALAMMALYGFRARAIFLVSGGFAFACIGFIALEAGHVAAFLANWPGAPFGMGEARAVIEGLMAAFLLLCFGTLSELRRLSPVASNIVLLLGGLAFALPVYGFLEPAIAAGLARGLFGATAVVGFATVFWLWRRGEDNIGTALVTWAAILLWCFIAAVAVLGDPRTSRLEPALLAGLGTVLVVMGFTLAHFAFSQGYLSRHFFREAGRRALALGGARAIVWDWQPEDGELYVGEEIEPALGLQPGMMAQGGIESFMEIMHPSDRSAYLGAVEAAEAQGRGTIEREFRLHHGDGSWRWFQLRARAVSGHGSRALRCIGTLTDITGAKRTEERLLSDAVYDAVTGLPNRALFMDRLGRALARTATDGGEVYVAVVDIDRFKTMNDALGHEAGDGLLSIIGRRLTAAADPEDTVARLPGDQFAVLFAGTGNRDIVEFTENLRRAVARPIKLDERELFLTASIGVAHGEGAGESAEQLMKDAAIALYEAKRQGPDSIMVFRPSMRDDRAELVVLESELRRAIERNEIEVHYQPIARLADMNLAGFEALVRWRHPLLGLLAPESFIGLAEQTGLIRDIGRAVINEAARQLGIWQRAFRPAQPVFVAVNVSSAQLIDTALVDDIKQVLHREGVYHQSLKIEITESLVMQFPERAAQILERLKELGVGLACDDFGTGYSSLSTLRKLPFDTLKIDKSFIEADAADERASIILQAIMSMAHALGLTIVAEGIENQEQVDRLGELACDLGQGFFIGPPMTARQVNDALAGLPYASASGRTAITWLWERAARDPSPAPAALDVTAAGIADARARHEAELAALRPPPPPPPPDPRPAPEFKPTYEPRPVAEEKPTAGEPEDRDAKPNEPGSLPLAPRLGKTEIPGEPVVEPEADAAAPPVAESTVVAINRPQPPRRRRRPSNQSEDGQA
jgi:diguanylate cyclase (GGDEF)-like protein/PAS domain S-box-containing protein